MLKLKQETFLKVYLSIQKKKAQQAHLIHSDEASWALIIISVFCSRLLE